MQKKAKYGMNLSIAHLLYINTSKSFSLKDYYPFGMVMPGRSFSSANYHFGYQGSLKDNEIQGSGNTYSTLFRELDVRLLKWWTPDPKASSMPWISPYASMNNNPIWINDILGDSAWTISNLWNNDYIKKFGDFVADKTADYTSGGKHFTCEDFTLTLALDFARENQLPFQFTNEQGTFDATSDKYTDFESFKNDILKSSGAPDFQNDLNTTPVPLSQVDAGTLILNRNSNNTATHMQMVWLVDSKFGNQEGIKTINIVQGNSGWLNNIPGGGRIGGANPTSLLYTGTSIQSGVYFPQINYYLNWVTGNSYTNFSAERNIEFRQFDFMGMNVNGAGGKW